MKIYDFRLFLESKKEVDEVRKEVKKIIAEMFTVGKNIHFSGEQNGEPEFVDFEINEGDYKLDYKGEDMSLEYSEGVLKKREYQVSLKFDSKYKEDSAYRIKFKIKLKPTSSIDFSKKEEEFLGWTFDEKPKEVLKFIKSEGKQKCEWNDVTGTLTIKKTAFDRLDKDELKVLIKDAGGEKVRVK